MQIPSPVQKLQGVVARIGDAFGVGARSAQYMARVLQADDSGLWPRAGSGRRTMVGVSDMTNLVVALACCSDRPGDASRVVGEFRALRAASGFRQTNDGCRAEPAVALDRFPSLAGWVDELLEGLIHPPEEGGPALHTNSNARLLRPTIRLRMTVPICAEVTVPADDGSGFDFFAFEVPDTTARRPSKLHQAEVAFGLPELEALAEIARAAYAPPGGLLNPSTSSPGRDEASATPETTKATGTGIHDGLLVEQTAPQAQSEPLHKAHSAIDKGSKQRLPESVGPRSQERHHPAPERKRRHVAHRTDPTPA